MSATKRLLFERLGWKGWSFPEGPEPLPPEIVEAARQVAKREQEAKARTQKRKARPDNGGRKRAAKKLPRSRAGSR